MQPLAGDATPELQEKFAHFQKTLGFVPNSFLTMQRRPKIVQAFTALNAAVFDPEGSVDLGFKRLLGYVASAAAGCQYCQAHTSVSATRHGISAEKMAAAWDFANSDLFTPAEKVALEFALCAAGVPNAVSDELFASLGEHWDEGEIVEMLAVISMFGFLNRWNDTMATPLEDEASSKAGELLAESGWEPGKHGD
jgi:uncharacterized peroxidase-related enzyme